MLTPEQFDAGIVMYLATFPNEKPNEITLKMWRASLSGLQPSAFLSGVTEVCVITLEVYPGTNVAALILDAALPDDAPGAAEAWQQVRIQVQRVGPYHQPRFSHPRIAEAVNVIGWRTLCDSEEIRIERAHFLKAYDALTLRDRRQRLLGSVHAGVQRYITEVVKALGSPSQSTTPP